MNKVKTDILFLRISKWVKVINFFNVLGRIISSIYSIYIIILVSKIKSRSLSFFVPVSVVTLYQNSVTMVYIPESLCVILNITVVLLAFLFAFLRLLRRFFINFFLKLDLFFGPLLSVILKLRADNCLTEYRVIHKVNDSLGL